MRDLAPRSPARELEALTAEAAPGVPGGRRTLSPSCRVVGSRRCRVLSILRGLWVHCCLTSGGCHAELSIAPSEYLGVSRGGLQALS